MSALTMIETSPRGLVTEDRRENPEITKLKENLRRQTFLAELKANPAKALASANLHCSEAELHRLKSLFEIGERDPSSERAHSSVSVSVGVSR
ncbi:hypothetical protein K6W36_17065 [Acetobacter senegalensis]|uniref:hypothetical protein n=1 Tax=Acetobacter senegalensis TaxID=446692 RepID=UPI001EDC80F3|nr:hypothetical protein [Acetobacter senegalensis]MCG4262263.1 hypothetical protein [Acetobacter senegalensis]